MKRIVQLLTLFAAALSLSIMMSAGVFGASKTTVCIDEEGTQKLTLVKGDKTTLVVMNGTQEIPASDVKFKSSKKTVAKITSAGVLSAVKKGTATITVRSNGLKKKIKVVVQKIKTDAGLTSSKGAGKMTCSYGTSIRTGRTITMKLNKTAVQHNWTWTFEGDHAYDARILKNDYKSTKRITFTVWPSGGKLRLVGTDPEGFQISYDFTVKQTKKWARREQFRTAAYAGITDSMTDAQKIRYFAKFIADRASYQTGLYYGIIDGKKGDCISYSVAFKFLADAAGIETIIVKNGGQKSHYWNQVKLDGVWYNVDVQGYDTSRSKKWVLSSDKRHGWYADAAFSAQNGIKYPFSPGHVCSVNYKKK